MCGEKREEKKVGGFDGSKGVSVKKELLLGVYVYEKRKNMQYR